MYKKKWIKLTKRNDNYVLIPEAVSNKPQCSIRINFTHLAFDFNDEYLVVGDSNGILYYIELSYDCPFYQKLGTIGQCTFVAFNPADKSEILIGLTSADIKILKIGVNIDQFCLLAGHSIPPTHISFYKHYGLTCSRKDVIIWYLKSCNKAHQLRVNTKNVIIKKAKFSNLGHIVVLYYNDTMQAWLFNKLNFDTKIDAKRFGLHNIKDFIFTTNGRAMIAGGQNKIIILNTYNWNLIKCVTFPENLIGAKQLASVPSPFDGGANKTIAIVSSNCQLHFFDLTSSCVVETSYLVYGITKIGISLSGRYIAYINKEGHLTVTVLEKLLSVKHVHIEKLDKSYRPQAHKVNDHLQCIRREIKEELRLERLIPILKEFGEYPANHRVTIWSVILRLPLNKNAYIALSNEVAHETYIADILKNYTLTDRSKLSLLKTSVKCLMQWCPLLVHCSYLPNFIFPFLMVFQKNPLLAFESILSIIFNYCQKWFEYHPLPPLNVLGIIENILLDTDPSLLNIFCEHGITSTEYAWPLLQTAMSEVLSEQEWLILWDHLLSYQKPSLLLMCIVAYNICSRDIIITILQSSKDITLFYSSQSHLRAKDIIKFAQQLDHTTPDKLHPRRYLRNEYHPLPSEGSYPPFMLQEYPKFLTEDLDILQMKKLKDQKQVIQQQSRRAMCLAEEKRLHYESEAFMKHIQQARLNEVKKCIQEQARGIKNLQLENRAHSIYVKPSYDSSNSKLASKSNSKSLLNTVSVPSSKKSKNYEKLQKDIEMLECEVQNFLGSIRSRNYEDG